MDQLFDRLGNLLKSWVSQDDERPRPFSDPAARGSGDPFLDEAMSELDAFLEDDREKQDRLAREREARARAEDEARARRGASRPAGPPAKLVAAYKTLGLNFGAPFDAVRAAYKRLLKEHHPDRHANAPEAMKKATETSARINDAYRLLETWNETGTLGDE